MIERTDLTVIEGDARVSCRVLQHQLGFSRIGALHRLIRANLSELEEYGPVCLEVERSDNPQGGRPRKVYYLNEDQVSALTLWAETPEAREQRQRFIETLCTPRAEEGQKTGFFDSEAARNQARQRKSEFGIVQAEQKHRVKHGFFRCPRTGQKIAPAFLPGHLVAKVIRVVEAVLFPLVMAGPELEKRLRPHAERLSDIPSPTRAERARRAAILWLIGSPESEPEPTEADLARLSASQDVARGLSALLPERQKLPSAGQGRVEELHPIGGEALPQNPSADLQGKSPGAR